MGDPDLSTGEREPERRSARVERGLVVFPAPERSRRQTALARYAPFLITVALGTVLVVIVALVR